MRTIYRNTAALSLSLLLLAPLFSFAAPAGAGKTEEKPLAAARRLLLAGDVQGAVAAYNPLARGSRDPELAAEYAYVQALSGNGDLALAHLDRAFIEEPTDPVVLFYASEVLDAYGLTVAAKELARPAPEWLGTPAKPARLKREGGGYAETLAAANKLIDQRRYVSAAVRFSVLVGQYPKIRRPWQGYAVVLEKLGAFKSAAKAVDKAVQLAEYDPPETIEMMNKYKAELEARPPVEYKRAPKLNEMLKGRYLLFAGFSYNHTETDAVSMLNSRVGKFLTNRIDVGASFSYTGGNESSDFNGVGAGVSGRYSKPLPVAMPLNLTGAARLEYQPAPDNNLATVLSPGLSYILPDGSLDLYLDFSLTGPYKGTQTLSLGYTVYFGGTGK